MNDNLPPLPPAGEHLSKWAYDENDMQAYARAAIERQSVQDARVIECAQRLVQHADFQLGGALSADSKPKEIPSNAASKVKARHLAALRDALAAAPQPQPVQQTPTIKDYLIVQSTVPLPADFLQFWQAINPKAMTRRVLALTAWNISKHEAKKQFKTMTISKTFDNSNAENLTILDLSDKVFLRDLSTQAKEMAESPGCTPAWAATYMALEASASMLADLIENTEVRDA